MPLLHLVVQVPISGVESTAVGGGGSAGERFASDVLRGAGAMPDQETDSLTRPGMQSACTGATDGDLDLQVEGLRVQVIDGPHRHAAPGRVGPARPGTCHIPCAGRSVVDEERVLRARSVRHVDEADASSARGEVVVIHVVEEQADVRVGDGDVAQEDVEVVVVVAHPRPCPFHIVVHALRGPLEPVVLHCDPINGDVVSRERGGLPRSQQRGHQVVFRSERTRVAVHRIHLADDAVLPAGATDVPLDIRGPLLRHHDRPRPRLGVRQQEIAGGSLVQVHVQGIDLHRLVAVAVVVDGQRGRHLITASDAGAAQSDRVQAQGIDRDEVETPLRQPAAGVCFQWVVGAGIGGRWVVAEVRVACGPGPVAHRAGLHDVSASLQVGGLERPLQVRPGWKRPLDHVEGVDHFAVGMGEDAGDGPDVHFLGPVVHDTGDHIGGFRWIEGRRAVGAEVHPAVGSLQWPGDHVDLCGQGSDHDVVQVEPMHRRSWVEQTCILEVTGATGGTGAEVEPYPDRPAGPGREVDGVRVPVPVPGVAHAVGHAAHAPSAVGVVPCGGEPRGGGVRMDDPAGRQGGFFRNSCLLGVGVCSTIQPTRINSSPDSPGRVAVP